MASLFVSLIARVVLTGADPSRLALGSPFVAPAGWQRAYGSPQHTGDDQFAQDWIKPPGDGSMRGEAVLAPLSGRVVSALWTCSSYGKTVVVLDDAHGLAVRLAHLDEIFVSAGSIVEAGTPLGIVGKSGPASTCNGNEFLRAPQFIHLHVALYRNVESIVGRPITEINLTESERHAAPFCFRAEPADDNARSCR